MSTTVPTDVTMTETPDGYVIEGYLGDLYLVTPVPLTEDQANEYARLFGIV